MDKICSPERFLLQLQLDRRPRNQGLSAELYVFLLITGSDNVDK
jgi:hypothetical protein